LVLSVFIGVHRWLNLLFAKLGGASFLAADPISPAAVALTLLATRFAVSMIPAWQAIVSIPWWCRATNEPGA
jgi:hypothetical protein